MRGWFLPDFISAIPFSLIASMFESDRCEKRAFAPFLYKNDDFTKTGSGQTQENLRKEAFVFCNRDVIRRQTTELGEAHEDTLATRR